MSGPIATARLDTPIGTVVISADHDALTSIRVGCRDCHGRDAIGHPLLTRARAQLSAWFRGERTSFDLPLCPSDTEEAAALRAAIASVPYGETITYGQLAERVGSVARAVGQACKSNRFPIVIPCHRVVSAAGPEFYSAGAGPRTKTWLNDFEHDHLPPERRTRLL